ncbi:MAG: AAA family ATPase [Spirochaetae bacterium HGW-Spirochaetae-8]|nr:MAG: AAA family ATPase [Spirochaetae bacterium HGW-Spirochaetae-8]
MRIDLSSSLNEEQCRAASIVNGPLLIIAGAGSGKTRMICYRIANLLQEGIAQNNILALTFTNKAAAEMAQRIRELIGTQLPELVTSTFHAFGMNVLKRYIHLLGYKHNFTIHDTADKHALLRQILLDEQMDPQAYDLFELSQLFSDIKNNRTSWKPEHAKILKGLYDSYREHLKAYNAVDFDDLIMMPIDLFTRYPQVLEEYRMRFSHIMVDEFQDTSLEQYMLVRLLAQKNRNLCVVGDDDQSIYSWRGANYQNIVLFEQDFPERQELKLERNYRSTGTILAAANTLIIHNSNRKPKALWTESASGSSITLLHPTDEEDEAATIVRLLRQAAYENRLLLESFGVLVRTNNLIPTLENRFMLENLPCIVSGGQSFFERKEVRDMISYLKLLANPDDDIAFLRIVNTPRRGIGRTSLEKIRLKADNAKVSLYSAMGMLCAPDSTLKGSFVKSLGALYELIQTYRDAIFHAGKRKHAVLKQLIGEINYRNYIAEEHPGNENMVNWKMKSLDTFVALFARWENNPDNHNQSLYEYLNRITLTSKDNQDEDQTGKINLMTMHASKGLEFDTVFLAGIEDHIIPHARALEENPEAIEEERRLFYVAITRARRELFISSCETRKRNRDNSPSQPSRFLSEIPADLFVEPAENRELSQSEAFNMLVELRKRLAGKEVG